MQETGMAQETNLKLTKATLTAILKNRAYLGEFHYDGKEERHGVVWKGHHQEIVSPVIFGKVQKVLERNRRKWIAWEVIYVRLFMLWRGENSVKKRVLERTCSKNFPFFRKRFEKMWVLLKVFRSIFVHFFSKVTWDFFRVLVWHSNLKQLFFSLIINFNQ